MEDKKSSHLGFIFFMAGLVPHQEDGETCLANTALPKGDTRTGYLHHRVPALYTDKC